MSKRVSIERIQTCKSCSLSTYFRVLSLCGYCCIIAMVVITFFIYKKQSLKRLSCKYALGIAFTAPVYFFGDPRSVLFV